MAVHGGHVVGGERVRQYAHVDPAIVERTKERDAAFAGNDVGVGDEQLFLRPVEYGEHLAQHSLRHAVRRYLVVNQVARAGVQQRFEFREFPSPVFRLDRERGQLFRVPVLLLQFRPGSGCALRVRLRGELLRRRNPLAVPEIIEHAVRFPGDFADREHIEIMEVVVPVQAEVVIADVASADDRGTAVGNQQLVVHAGIQPLHLRDHLAAPRDQAAFFPGIEETHLDVRVPLEIGMELLLPGRHEVVHDQSNADAAMRGKDGALQDQAPGRVRIPEVGHDIERRDRGVDQRQPPCKRVVAEVEQVKTGVLGTTGRTDTGGYICECTARRGSKGIARHRAFGVLPQFRAGAGPQYDGKNRQQELCLPAAWQVCVFATVVN